MGLATTPPPQRSFTHLNLSKPPPAPSNRSTTTDGTDVAASMSQGFHQGLFSFSDAFNRSESSGQDQQQHIAQQSRRDKLRVQGFDPLVPLEEGAEEPSGIYEPHPGATNMLSEMFNFHNPAPSATELLASQMQAGFGRIPQSAAAPGFSADWYQTMKQHQDSSSSQHNQQQQQHAMSGLNADSAAAMQLFLMSPQAAAAAQSAQQRSPSPSLHHQTAAFQAAASFGDASFGGGGGVVAGQALSLSLQPFEMAKAEELSVREGVLYFNPQQQQQQQHQDSTSSLHFAVQQGQQSQAVTQMGYGGSGTVGMVSILRTSKYARPAQELLEEFCSVGRGQLKGSRLSRHHRSSPANPSSSATAAAGASSSSSKEVPSLSPADRFEHQRKKAKLLSMLDEVDRRYNHYCDQMQMVVNSFDSVMGFGAATPYTALAQKAMSRHFRCLKDAISAQLKQTCELLGEKDGGSNTGLTKGETPRLKLLDQTLRQQRAFHQMGMMEQEAWRPQRGLPERSVTILRAWLFEHFLHPYPSDADKHMLARQTGLSRNQVSNWFINARVRLWKPMVEEMYQQEEKGADQQTTERGETSNAGAAGQNTFDHHSPTSQQQQQQQKQEVTAVLPDQSMEPSSSVSVQSRPIHRFSGNLPQPPTGAAATDDSILAAAELIGTDQHVGSSSDIYHIGDFSPTGLGPAARMRLGAAGDVSLTLGLRHAGGGNAAGGQPPEHSRFSSLRDFS